MLAVTKYVSIIIAMTTSGIFGFLVAVDWSDPLAWSMLSLSASNTCVYSVTRYAQGLQGMLMLRGRMK